MGLVLALRAFLQGTHQQTDMHATMSTNLASLCDRVAVKRPAGELALLFYLICYKLRYSWNIDLELRDSSVPGRAVILRVG